MICIIDAGDYWASRFAYFLSHHQLDHECITLSSLLNEAIVYDHCQKNICEWILGDRRIDFGSFTGLYHNIDCLSEDLFSRFKEGDREYLASEWNAYLLYRLSRFSRSINKVNHQSLSHSYLNHHRLLKTAKSFGIDVPSYYISSNVEEVREKAGNRSVIYLRNMKQLKQLAPEDHSAFNEKPVGFIEYIDGATVFIHQLRDELFATAHFQEGQALINLPEHLKEKILCLSKFFSLNYVEYCFKLLSDGSFYLYSLNKTPNWNRSMLSENEIWFRVYNMLSEEAISISPIQRELIKTELSFIPEYRRPESHILTVKM